MSGSARSITSPRGDVSIIIISYNTREMTLACLESVYAEMGDVHFRVIVVDNASQDGSADAIADRFPQAELIRSDENIGFAAANNLAAERAESEYLLLLNPDTVVLDCAIDRLMEFARRTPERGIWGGRTVFADGSLNPTNCWKRMTIWGLACRAVGLATLFPRSSICNPEGYGAWSRDTERDVDIVTGCFFLIRTGLWRELGGFDRSFFMYGEEADLCLRARRLGARPGITPEATIVHYGGASERVRADKVVRLLMAKRLLISRHFGPVRGRVAGALLAAWPATRAIASAVLGRSSAWSEVWVRRGEWLNPEGTRGEHRQGLRSEEAA